MKKLNSNIQIANSKIFELLSGFTEFLRMKSKIFPFAKETDDEIETNLPLSEELQDTSFIDRYHEIKFDKNRKRNKGFARPNGKRTNPKDQFEPDFDQNTRSAN